MNKQEALDILKAFAICHVASRKITCEDCPFVGEFIKEDGRNILPCSYYKKVSNDRLEEAIMVLMNSK